MGFADMLIRLGIPYNSTKAIEFAERLMRFIHKESLKASQSLAAERGVFPNYEKSIYAKKGLRMRNATVNTIAPTGTISIIAGCSSGIEPLFAISFVRNVLSGTKLFEVNPLFEEMAKARGFYSKELIAEIAQSGSLQKIKGIPGDVKRTFVTAFDVTPKEHVQIQAAFQKYTDNSVSKTINLPVDATVDDVRKIYLLAYKLKCKGITIYRYGSKKDQVLSFGYRKIEEHPEVSGPVSVDSEYSGGCATGLCPF
jgi:ribonucleoside-diphosphate reductase alpha chain